MFGFGLGEWVLILLIAMLLFGPRLFVRAGTNVGQSVTGFMKAFKTSQDETPALPPSKQE